jgi:hypothetical protein
MLPLEMFTHIRKNNVVNLLENNLVRCCLAVKKYSAVNDCWNG